MAGAPRNLIVLSDGTGNSASNPFKTNVWRLYQALDLKDGKQVAVFGDGVGTSSIKILRVIGLALGVGVKRNVLNLYKFLCHNYRDGDRIWAFGFSRGAFTIRVLVGLIHSQGLVTFETEAELQQNAIAAYRAYRKEAFATKIPWVWAGRHIRDALIWIWRGLTGGPQYDQVQEETNKAGRRHIPIHFVGVWDTVVAYGLPIDELTIAVDKWVWPMKFRDTSLLKSVQHARQALSLDDERRTFHPVPWDENAEKALQKDPTVNRNRLLQVWFPGMHADVGGGYPDDGLSFVPLGWMIDEAADKGLKFEDDIVRTYRALGSPTGRLYDSRAGFGALWRYQPRNAQFLMDNNRDDIPAAEMVTPLVHHSMVTRMTYGNDGYAPISLPLKIDILLPDRSRVAFESAPVDAALQETRKKLSAATSETRPALQRMEAVLTDLGAIVRASAGMPRADYFALVLDTVWYRRIVYFVTLGLALVALAYPLLYEILDLGDNTEKLNEVTTGSLIWLIALVKGFVPSFATPWLDAISANGLGAVVIGVLFVLSLALSGFLQGRIHDRGRAAWNVQQKVDGRKIQRLKPTGQRHALLTLAMIFIVLAAFTIPVAADNPKYFGTFVVFAVLFTALWAYRRIRPAEAVNPSNPRLPLRVARVLRTNPACLKGYRWVAQTLAPLIFIVAAGYLALSGAHLGIFELENTLGTYCEPKSDSNASQMRKAPPTKEELAQAAQEEKLGSETINIASLCASTGLKLVAGRHYRIRLETDDWFDKAVPVDVAGFSTDSIRHVASATLKRWWREKWFQPIARVGRFGNYEYPLKPAAPLAAANFAPCKAEPPSVLAAFADTLLHPGKIVDAIRDIPIPAPKEVIDKQLACERDKDIRRAKLLISDITPGTTGELFIYVNDAALAVPWWANFFYRNNTGTAKVTVTRTLAPATVDFQPAEGGQPPQRN